MEAIMSFESRKNEVLKSAESLRDEASSKVASGVESVQRDATKLHDAVTDMAGTVSSKLKTVGVDTDVMVTAAKDQASELQRLISDELRARPLRALGIAAAVGLIVGLLTSR